MSYTDDEIRAMPLAQARQELLEEIMSTPTLETLDEVAPHERKRPRWLVAVVAAAAVLAIIGVPVWVASTRSDSTHIDGGFSSQVIKQAEKSTRVLIGEPGWSITYVDGFGKDEGEMRFTKGDKELAVHWRAASTYDGYVVDRNDIGTPEQVDVLGKPSKLWSYSATDLTSIRPVEGATFLEVRGGVGDKAAYLAVLDKLEIVDVETWLKALPPSVVLPGERGAEIAKMLEGIPVPAGFEPKVTEETSERYHVGADVAGQVMCAWIEQWKTGDATTKRKAVDALQTSHHWPILIEMKKQGDYSDVVWEIADELEAGTLNLEYKQGLGCE
jgi:hypothetical protein